MDQIAVLYNWLAGDLSPEVNAILAAALAHAEPRFAERIGGILLQRRQETAWTGLVAGYRRLSAVQQAQVRARPDLMHLGVNGALKLASPQARANALALLVDQPCAPVLYLVAEALQDSAPQVRELAGAALRSAAERLLTVSRLEPINANEPAPVAEGRAPVTGADRPLLWTAMLEALRTYEIHRRPEVLEACLWHAAGLGDALWTLLGHGHAAAATTIEAHLAEWSGPRLAPFLLIALARPAWRQRALAILGGWRTVEQLAALLENSHLLAIRGIQENLHLLKRPAFLAAAGAGLQALTPQLRARLPYWILYVGFSEEERLRFLRAWVLSNNSDLQRGAAYALAVLGTPAAVKMLAAIADEPGTSGWFARWFVAGWRAVQRAPVRRASHL